LSTAFRQAFLPTELKSVPSPFSSSSSSSSNVTVNTPILNNSESYGSTAVNATPVKDQTKDDGAASVDDSVLKTGLPDGLPVQLIGIGLGTPAFAKKFAKKYNFAGQIYVDPTKALFNKVGFNRKTSFQCGACLYGCVRALAIMCTRCWCQCGAGDVVQNGGVLVFNAQRNATFTHKSANPKDHVKPESVINAARQAVDSAQYQPLSFATNPASSTPTSTTVESSLAPASPS